MGPNHPHYTLYIAHKMNPSSRVWLYSELSEQWLSIESTPSWITFRHYAVSVEKPTWTPVPRTTRSM